MTSASLTHMGEVKVQHQSLQFTSSYRDRQTHEHLLSSILYSLLTPVLRKTTRENRNIDLFPIILTTACSFVACFALISRNMTFTVALWLAFSTGTPKRHFIKTWFGSSKITNAWAANTILTYIRQRWKSIKNAFHIRDCFRWSGIVNDEFIIPFMLLINWSVVKRCTQHVVNRWLRYHPPGAERKS